MTVTEALTDARTSLTTDLRSGFLTLDQAIERAVEAALDEREVDDRDEFTARVRAIAIEELSALRADRATWPATTDNDRLEQAFAALETDGIIAREDFTCCQSCGVAEIDDEAEAAREEGRHVRGYAFYHQQDTESAVDGGGVMLAYGSFDDQVTGVEIGRTIEKALRDAGLEVNWNGDVSRRIGVPLVWQRRTNAALE